MVSLLTFSHSYLVYIQLSTQLRSTGNSFQEISGIVMSCCFFSEILSPQTASSSYAWNSDFFLFLIEMTLLHLRSLFQHLSKLFSEGFMANMDLPWSFPFLKMLEFGMPTTQFLKTFNIWFLFCPIIQMLITGIKA